MSRTYGALLASLLACRVTSADQILYSASFGGSSADLNGQSPDNTSSVKWVASSIFNADGSIEAAGAGSATLSFSPTAGRIYTLDASFRNLASAAGASTPNENDWLGLGFATGQSTTSTSDDRFITGNVVGTAWSFVRGSTTSNGGNNALLGGTSNSAGWSSLNTARGGDMDMRIVLDTTDIWGDWTATWYARRPTDTDYTKVRDTTSLLSNSINSVGLAKSGTGVAGSASSFSISSVDKPGITARPDAYIHTSTIGTAYGLNPINGVSFARNNVTTVGDQQFVAYYEPDTAANDGYDGHVVLARRTIGSDTWHLSETNFLSNNITDSHDVISIAVDGDGIMHMSWGMHANQGGGTNYVKSTGSVLTPGSPISFTSNLGSSGMTGNETQVTYPEFVRLADGGLLFFYRSGSSGNGDLRLNRYDTATDTWFVVQQPLVDGFVSGQDAVTTNAYWNTPTIDAEGKLHLSWLFRDSSVTYQTNHGLYYAVSSDIGQTWQKDDGTYYAMPITQSTSDLVVDIPQNYSYINQTSMTVDQNNLPIIVSRWAPETGSGNDQAQQVIEWFDGTDWHVSQVTQFTPGSSAGRRASVLVNEDGRVLVLIAGSSLGNLVLAHSMDREHWEFIDLGVGSYGLDPTYDLERWLRDGVISMLYQRTGSESETLSLYEFDARSYFAVPEPTTTSLVGIVGLLTLSRRRRRSCNRTKTG